MGITARPVRIRLQLRLKDRLDHQLGGVHRDGRMTAEEESRETKSKSKMGMSPILGLPSS